MGARGGTSYGRTKIETMNLWKAFAWKVRGKSWDPADGN